MVFLMPVITKMMKANVAKTFMVFLEKSNITVPEQHGFRQRQSYATKLLIVSGI